LISLLLFCVSAAPVALVEPQRFEFTQVHMGMPVRVVLYAAERPAAESAARAAFARITELDAMLSDYRPDSELSRLSASARVWIRVSPELCDVLGQALTIAERSGGAFDPTVGPLVDLWRDVKRTRQLPAADRVEEARARVGWQHVSLERAPCRARLARDGMRLDLGGIAKGFVLQHALAALAAHGVSRALLEAGGDLVVGDAPPGRQGWDVAAPHADSAFQARARTLVHAALATSGPTSQFVEIDGVRYSHVIDPRSGRPLTSTRVVSVIANDGVTADALATALTVADDRAGERLLAQYPGAIATGGLKPAGYGRDER
jgi:thiamine biosynthesis lipoprotein